MMNSIKTVVCVSDTIAHSTQHFTVTNGVTGCINRSCAVLVMLEEAGDNRRLSWNLSDRIIVNQFSSKETRVIRCKVHTVYVLAWYRGAKSEEFASFSSEKLWRRTDDVLVHTSCIHARMVES